MGFLTAKCDGNLYFGKSGKYTGEMSFVPKLSKNKDFSRIKLVTVELAARVAQNDKSLFRKKNKLQFSTYADFKASFTRITY